MAKNFFDLLGFSSDELADTMPERIVQAFHDNGKEGVRVLMYEEMALRLNAPLYIHNCDAEGNPSALPDVYGREQPGEAIRLIRDNTDLYRRYGDPISSPERGDSPGPAAPAPPPRKRGAGGGTKTTGPDAWEKRFADLHDFVSRNGFRPRRTAPEDSERHLHYWMGQQQRKLGHNELSREQAERLEALLMSTKGKKADGGSGRSRPSGSRSKSSAAARGGDDDDEDTGDLDDEWRGDDEAAAGGAGRGGRSRSSRGAGAPAMADEAGGRGERGADGSSAGSGGAGASRAGSCAPPGGAPLSWADGDDSSSDDEPVEEFEADELEEADTTAQQAAAGRDLQGIAWERLQARAAAVVAAHSCSRPRAAGTARSRCAAARRRRARADAPAPAHGRAAQVSRVRYRAQRVSSYRNYTNVIDEAAWPAVRRDLLAGWAQPPALPAPACPYAFVRNWRRVASSIVHFQLRNLCWAGSAHDVYVVHDNRVRAFNTATRALGDVLDLRGPPKGPRLPGLGRVQVSSMCVAGELLAAGGFTGELVLARLDKREPGWSSEEEEAAEAAEQAAAAADSAAMDTAENGWDGPDEAAAQAERPWQLHQQQQQQPQQPQQPLGQPGQPPRAWACRQQQWPGVALLEQAQSRAREQQQPQQPQQRQPHAGPPRVRRRPQPAQQPAQQQAQRPPPGGGAQSGGERVMCAAGPEAAELWHSCRVTQSENGITNGIEIFDSCSAGACVMTSNNDACVRLFDVAGARPRGRLALPWAVNYASLRPDGASVGGGSLVAVVGDDPATLLLDVRSGLEVMKLVGHRDFSFAVAWHPDGQLLATGNQDATTRLWDVRQPGASLAVLGGAMGAVRSLRFSPDGALLAAAEPADFVHVYALGPGGAPAGVQEVDLFGEISGTSFSPDGAALFVAVSDALYSSVLHFSRAPPRPRAAAWW
ncbi:SPBC2A9.03 [Scenedesmus sp. PABB004]|nr:SPBC2A9.03 [Scenedesmus sp. PABB004]